MNRGAWRATVYDVTRVRLTTTTITLGRMLIMREGMNESLGQSIHGKPLCFPLNFAMYKYLLKSSC